MGLEFCILLLEQVVLFFQPLGGVLKRDVAFDLAVLVLCDARLEVGELALFAFTKSPLSSAIRREFSEDPSERLQDKY